MSNTSTRSGRNTVPSSRLVESREHAAASQAADRGGKKRRAPGEAPPPRAKTRVSAGGAASSSMATPVAKLTQEEINILLQARAAKEKQTNMAASAKRQATKNNKGLSSSAAAAKTIEDARRKADQQALLEAEFAADDLEDEDEPFEVAVPATKRQKTHNEIVSVDSDDEGSLPGHINPQDGEGVEEYNGEHDDGSHASDEEGDLPDSTNSLKNAGNGMDVIDLDVATPQKKDRRGKVAENDFTPRTLKLAKKAKSEARALTLTEEAYPLDANAASMRALINTVENAADHDVASLRDALDRAKDSVDVRDNLLTFVGYAATGIRGEITTKVKELCGALTGIPGNYSEAQIRARVSWMLRGMRYMYGGVDNETVDRSQPFHCIFLKPVIQQTVFGKGRANREAARNMIEEREIPANLFAMVGAAVKHTLKCWSTGVPTNAPFTESEARDSYRRHRVSFATLEAKAPKFTAKMKFNLLHAILRDSGKANLLDDVTVPDADHLKDVDFDALEASVESEDGEAST